MKYIEEKAVKLLADLGMTELPIDPKICADRLGVNVEASVLDDDISGLFVADNNEYFIIYNDNESNVRQRFTIAHELGHYLLHKDSKLFVDRKQRALYRNAVSATGEVLREREANSFAAALLMPEKLIEEEVWNLTEEDDIVYTLADKFGVSKLAMSFRLSNLGYELG